MLLARLRKALPHAEDERRVLVREDPAQREEGQVGRARLEGKRVPGRDGVGARKPGKGREKGGADGRRAGVEIRTMRISEILPAELNPRTISASAFSGLSGSLKRFGYVEPMVWNRRSGRLVSGHQRLRALSEQGFSRADVSVVDLSPEEESALLLTMNNPHIQGEFTADVSELLAKLDPGKLDLGEVGFAPLMEDLARLVKSANPDPPGEFPAVDENIPTDSECPKCGYRWSGKKA